MIKKLILVSALLSFNAQANDDDFKKCKDIEGVAGLIMEMRQKGTPMSDMIKAANGDPLGKVLIIEAYDRPKYSTDQNKKDAVQRFKNIIFGTCIKDKKAAS